MAWEGHLTRLKYNAQPDCSAPAIAARNKQEGIEKRIVAKQSDTCWSAKTFEWQDFRVGRPGLEPGTYGLKVRSSAIELATPMHQ